MPSFVVNLKALVEFVHGCTKLAMLTIKPCAGKGKIKKLPQVEIEPEISRVLQ